MPAQELKTVSIASLENVEIIRRAYEAFNTVNMQTLTELFDESSSWHTPGRTSIGGDRYGRDATFGQFGRFVGETEGTFRAELKQLFAADDGRVIAMHHNVGDRNGKHLEADCCIIFELKDGRIISGRENFYDLYAWDEFWA
jgi:uncharacterized protein